MESRRLVVWISAGILGFQGVTLAFDLLNCTVLSWLFVRQHGLGVVVAPAREREAGGVGAPVALPEPHEGAGGGQGGRDGVEEAGGQGSGSGAAQARQASPPALKQAQRPQQPSQLSQGPAPTVSAF